MQRPFVIFEEYSRSKMTLIRKTMIYVLIWNQEFIHHRCISIIIIFFHFLLTNLPIHIFFFIMSWVCQRAFTSYRIVFIFVKSMSVIWRCEGSSVDSLFNRLSLLLNGDSASLSFFSRQTHLHPTPYKFLTITLIYALYSEHIHQVAWYPLTYPQWKICSWSTYSDVFPSSLRC